MQVPSAVVLVRPLFLTCRWPPSQGVLTVTFSLHMHRELWCLTFLNKDTIPVRLGPHFMTSFNYLPKDSVSRYSHIVEQGFNTKIWGVGIQFIPLQYGRLKYVGCCQKVFVLFLINCVCETVFLTSKMMIMLSSCPSVNKNVRAFYRLLRNYQLSLLLIQMGTNGSICGGKKSFKFQSDVKKATGLAIINLQVTPR